MCLTASSKLILLDGKDWETVNNVAGFRPQHLYILSSEEIKEGEWCYHPEVGQEYTIVDTRKEGNDRYSKGQHPAQGIFKYKETTNTWYKKCKKIIATTDSSLLIDIVKGEIFAVGTKLPRPSDDFIKAFVKAQGKGFDKVLVEYENHFVLGNYMNTCIVCQKQFSNTDKHWKYCQEHSIKLKVAPDNTITIRAIQEEKTSWSREEAAERLYPLNYHTGQFNPNNVWKRDIFIKGAKWQQEQYKNKYSEEDLRNAYRWGTTVNHGTKEHFNDWFEQFKKK